MPKRVSKRGVVHHSKLHLTRYLALLSLTSFAGRQRSPFTSYRRWRWQCALICVHVTVHPMYVDKPIKAHRKARSNNRNASIPSSYTQNVKPSPDSAQHRQTPTIKHQPQLFSCCQTDARPIGTTQVDVIKIEWQNTVHQNPDPNTSDTAIQHRLCELLPDRPRFFAGY